MTDPLELATYYDDLSRFELARRSLTMHKDFPRGASLDEWVHTRVAARGVEKLLDIGCGFGTSLAGMRSLSEAHGLTISPFQKRTAERLHASRPQLKFFVGSYEQPLPGIYDALLSIESLVFATTLETTLRNLERHLEPSGRIFLIEDMSVSKGPEEWEAHYCEGFRLARVYRAEDFEKGFDAAGLVVEDCVDLTPRLELRPGRWHPWRARSWSALTRLAPTRAVANVASAYWGGVFLERLYAEGAFSYRFYELRKAGP